MKRVWSDESKFAKWLQVEVAVCEAWSERGVVPNEALPEIRKARCDLARMNEILKETHHDVTAFLGAVAESIGEESRYIHLGLTSSDIMDTALALQMVEASSILSKGMGELTKVIEEQARAHKHTITMGRTHGVHAEPTTFGLKLAIWVEEMKRNSARFADATRAISVGKISGAVGTHATVPPEVEKTACARLGLEAAPVSNQVVQRDRHAQFITSLAITASSLEKFATEIRALQRTEVLEAEEPFEKGQTGSSAMPHKRNPELCERVTGLARVARANAMASLENISLWHERDISHSSVERIIIPDSCLLLDYVLPMFTSIVAGLKVNVDKMRENVELTHGLVFSQRTLIALIEKGMTRQDAYKVVQTNAMDAWNNNKDFRSLLESDAVVKDKLSTAELDAIFDYGFYTREVDRIFERAGITGEAAPLDASLQRLAPHSY